MNAWPHGASFIMATVLLELVGDSDSDGPGLYLSSLLDLDSEEVVKLVASYADDLYVGTDDKISHYTFNKDGDQWRRRSVYQCQGTPRKLLVLKHSRILLVLAGTTCLVFPCAAINLGPLKVFREVLDVLVAPPIQLPKLGAEPQPEKVLILRPSLAKFLLFSDSKASTISETAYQGALGGMAMQTLGRCILYDEQVYELVDTSKNTSKTTLFEHGQDNHMIAFSVGNSSVYEYLLTIQPDPEAAMAMFVDEQGNATRGTLLWLQRGSPSGGVALLWPLVYGIFNSEANGNNRLVVCSLETLEEVASCALDDKLNTAASNDGNDVSNPPLYGICSVDTVVMNREIASLQRSGHSLSESLIRNQGNILVFQHNHIWLLHDESRIEWLLRDYYDCLEADIDAYAHRLNENLKDVDSVKLLFCVQLLAVLQIRLGRSEEAQQSLLRLDDHGLVVDPKAAQYILRRDELLVASQFTGIVDACKRFPSESLELDTYLLGALTISKDQEIIGEIRLLAYTLLPPQSMATFIDYDLNWTGDNTQNETIIRILRERSASETLIVALDRLIVDGDTSLEISEQYCVLSLEQLQSGRTPSPGAFKVLERVKNVSDKTTYSKILIGMLELDKTATIDFLKKNKKSSLSDVHRDLLMRLGSEEGDDGAVIRLKIEYLETLLEDRACCEQLHRELLTLARTAYDPECAANFEILKATFLVENSLASNVWPKLTWPDFLAIAGPHSECGTFVDLYLKLYELSRIIPWDCTGSECSAFDYFCLFSDKEKTITSLLLWSDYTTAEFYAIHGVAPELKFPHYPSLYSTDNAGEPKDVLTDLCCIFTFYVAKFRDEPQNLQCIQHFIAAYGKSIFSAGQILEMLPKDLPLVHVKSYFDDVLVTGINELEAQHLRKVLCKASLRKEKSLQKLLQN